MVTKRFKYTTLIYVLLLGLVAARNPLKNVPFLSSPFCREAIFIMSSLIVVGILFHWATTINRRVMHKNIKIYILTVVWLQIFWLTIRNMKWFAFGLINTESRFMWYLFYIPMLLIPVFLLLIALSVNQDESYRLSKKWNLLFVPTILLILLVLTNDMHQLVFQFNPNFENWDKGYSYGPLYPIVIAFTVLAISAVMITLFRKWRKLDKSKQKLLFVFISGIAVAYLITYIVNRPLANIFIDITVFFDMICILFLESCIQMGLIRSNNRHQEIFAKADITAQILNQDGETQYHSSSNTDISKIDFMILKENQQLKKDENTLSHIAPIHGGYVTWNSDIAQINQTIKEIEIRNKGLYDEVELLKRVHTQKEERVRTEKELALHDAVLAEVRPAIEKIKYRIRHLQHDVDHFSR